MTQKQLHPTIIKFKEFVKKHPKISVEVKKGIVTWQELYEDWYLLGEDDPRWDAFKDDNKLEEPENKTDFITQIFDYIKTVDMNKMQQHIQHVSQALGAVQGVLSQFQTPSQPNQQKQSGPSHPFSFRKD